MCGIFCTLTQSDHGSKEHAMTVLNSCSTNLQRRGPDHFNFMPCELHSGHYLLVAAAVLQTQGEELSPQPYNNGENILCWNGDIFGGSLVNGSQQYKLSDTTRVFKHLSENLSTDMSPVNTFSKITGPYSFIFLSKETQILWFGRDPAGRHSLLFGLSKTPYAFTLSSVAHSSLDHMKELPAVGIFAINLNTLNDYNDLMIYLYPWHDINQVELDEHFLNFPGKIQVMPSPSSDFMFRPLPFDITKQMEERVDSLLQTPSGYSAENKLKFFLSLESHHKNMLKLLSLLETSVKTRIQANIHLCQKCKLEQKSGEDSCSHSKVAILFSGGLDCAILACLIDKFVPQNESIDLLNVAFEKKKPSSNSIGKKGQGNKKGCTIPSLNLQSCNETECIYNVPDRVSGLKTLEELQNICPSRRWNFVEINITLAELQEERSKCIVHLLHPLKTILDESLGCALWFAARGHGKLYKSGETYTCPARIIFSGMGADEQFGGYMRHRTTLRNEGWKALHEQLQMELKRIPSRNLGRDDRVISDHGRQPRMPFLDEAVVNFVKSLPPWERCCPNNNFPSGIGDKMLLRLTAWHIGLRGAAMLPKRALQFGSRIANSKENASDTSNRL